MSKLIRFVYFSQAQYEFKDEELRNLLQVCQANNKKNGISGLLVYHDLNFFQVLEGESDAVYALLSVIEQDTRHRDVMAVLEESISERSFANWSMGYLPIMGDQVLLQQMHDLRQAFPPDVQGAIFQSQTMPFLKGFYQRSRLKDQSALDVPKRRLRP